jgi:predicted permease
MRALRYALRQFQRRPGFSAIVVVTLALGIGATTAMFSLFHQVALRELPVPEPEQLVNLGAPGPKPGGTTCMAAGDCEQVFSYPMFRDIAARQTVFAELAGHYSMSGVNLSYHGQTLMAWGLLVSGGYFAALRVQPVLGRLLGPQDEPQLGESAVVVLSHDYWQSSLGADPNVVGQTLTVNGQALTIVGVAPAGFSGTTFGLRPRIFVPLTMRWVLEPTTPRAIADARRMYWVYLFGRLKPGISVEQARAGLNTLYTGIINEVEAPLNAELTPDVMARFLARQITVEPGARGQSLASEGARPVLAMLLGLTGVVLLIACINVANLMLARGAARAGELAIRSSIGANRIQLIFDLLVESLLLAVLGGLGSVPIAAATLRGVYAIVPAQLADGITLELSPAATWFAAVAALTTVLFFGLLPAIQATSADPGTAMKGHAHHALGGGRVARSKSILTTAQITFAMLLLVVAGLFAQTLANLARVELGMDVDSLVTFSVSPRANGYTPAQATTLYDRLERDLAAQPGVTNVASAMVPLLSFGYWGGDVSIEGRDAVPNEKLDAATNQVSTEFLRTLGIPLLAGRTFTDADAPGAPRVAVVNEAFVRKFRLANGAIGQRFTVNSSGPGPIEIVGVIGDAKYNTVAGDVPAQFILPRKQNNDLGGLTFYVRTTVSTDELMRNVRRVVADADPNLPVSALTTMPKVVEENLFADRLIARLSTGFAALATLLAAIGLYGVLAYNVAQRTRELGLRLALGATAAQLRTMVLRQVATIALIGIPIGLALGVALGQAAKALLFGLTGYDPWVLGSAVAVLAGVVLLAGYLPARRASAVAPMEALREE